MLWSENMLQFLDWTTNKNVPSYLRLHWKTIAPLSIITGRNGIGKSVLLHMLAYTMRIENNYVIYIGNEEHLFDAHPNYSPEVNYKIIFLDVISQYLDLRENILKDSPYSNCWTFKSDSNFELRPCFFYGNMKIVPLESEANIVDGNLEEAKEYIKQKLIEQWGSNKDPRREIKEFLESFAEFRYKVSFNGDNIIELKRPDGTSVDNFGLSSGEKVILSVLSWKYSQNNVFNDTQRKKANLIILDEPDKHLDPKLCKLFMKIILEAFVNQNIQVIMTTHKLDTIALIPSDQKCKIYTLKQNNNIVEIKETHKLLAMSRLTGNLREFTNFHIKVHVEAPDDMQFYDGIHKVLLHYCEEMRQINVGKVISQELSSMASRYWGALQEENIYQWNNRLLSKRYQPSFAATSANDDESGGGKSGIKSILPRELIMRQKQSSFYKQKENPIDLIDPIVESPFAIMDGDYDGVNKDNIDKDPQLKGRIVFLSRHSLENYLFDPWIVFSLISKEKLDFFFESSDFINICKNCIEYIHRIKNEKPTDDLNTPLYDYLLFIIDALLNNLEVLKHSLTSTIRICKIISKLEGEELFNAMTSSFVAVPKYLFKNFGIALNVQESEWRSYQKYRSKIDQGSKIDYLSLIVNTYKSYTSLTGDLSTRDIAKDIIKNYKEIFVIYDPLKQPLKFEYPTIFLRLRGHDFEDIILKILSQGKIVEGQNFKDYLLNKLYTVSSLCIPLDLANVFFELNNKLREQIYPTLKGVQLSAKVETALLHLEVRAKVKLADTHRLDIPYSTTEQALSDHLQGFSCYRTSNYHPYIGALNLKRAEKETLSHLTNKLIKTLFKYEYKRTVDHSIKLKLNTEITRPHIVIILFPEVNHVLFHGDNILSLIVAMKNGEITLDTTLCLERKQNGNNQGMPDVISLANYLERGNTIPAALQHLPIYYDALLYNAVKAKGIQVIGIEGKGLAYSKEAPLYHQAREEYMAKQLVAIAQSGKNAIFLVGSAHINNLVKLLGEQGFYIDTNSNALTAQNLITLKLQPLAALDNQLPKLPPVLSNIVNTENILTYDYTDIRASMSSAGSENSEVFTNIFTAFRDYFIKSFYGTDFITWQFKKLYYNQELSKFNSILKIYNIDKSPDVLNIPSEFRKVLLKLHPDKGGDPKDFIFVTSLQEKIKAEFDIKEFLDIQAIQPIIYKASIGLKALDTAIDVTRLIYIPTIDNAKKVLMDTAHIYSMYSGINGLFPIIINSYDVLYKAYKGEYYQAATQATTTVSYMLLPTMISYLAIPYIGFAYVTTLTLYTGYSVIINGYSLYNEFNQKDFYLNSNMAYQSLAQTLSTTTLQNFYDFSSKAKESEKSAHKIKLEEKGEFGQKLYEYIYFPMIEEKYNLQDRIAQGILTVEETNELKAKHIKTLDYDHCMEVVALKEDDQQDHYYCYNEKQEILDHIVIIGETYIEKISSL